MNTELDKLLCLLDGKITAYRMNNPDKDIYDNKDAKDKNELKFIQRRIQVLWEENKNGYWINKLWPFKYVQPRY